MTLNAETPHFAALKLADLFEPGHDVARDMILSVRYPSRIAIDTPDVRANPLHTFHEAIKTIAAWRRSLYLVAGALGDAKNPAQFSFLGTDLTVTTLLGHVHLSAWPGSVDYEGFVQSLVTLGLLQQLFADNTAAMCGMSVHYIERAEWIGDHNRRHEFFPSPYRDAVFDHTIMRPGEFASFGDDLAMLINEKVVVGLRNRWARQVAVPMVHAYRHLTTSKNAKEAKAGALEIVAQCQDLALRRSVENYLHERHSVVVNLQESA